MSYEWRQADNLQVGESMQVAYRPPKPSRKGVQIWTQKRRMPECMARLAAKWPERSYVFHDAPLMYAIERIK